MNIKTIGTAIGIVALLRSAAETLADPRPAVAEATRHERDGAPAERDRAGPLGAADLLDRDAGGRAHGPDDVDDGVAVFDVLIQA